MCEPSTYLGSTHRRSACSTNRPSWSSGPMARRSSLRRKGRWGSRAVQRIMPCTHLGSTPSKTRSLSPSSTLNAHFPLIGASRTIRAAEHSGDFYFGVTDPYYRGFNRTHTRFCTHVFSHQTLHPAFIHSISLTHRVRQSQNAVKKLPAHAVWSRTNSTV